jgi:hypothetical protein
VAALLGRSQADMLEAATARRDASITDCATLDEAREAAQTGVARVPAARRRHTAGQRRRGRRGGFRRASVLSVSRRR